MECSARGWGCHVTVLLQHLKKLKRLASCCLSPLHAVQDQAGMPPRLRARALYAVLKVVAGLLVVAFAALVATLGGFLNHCRGGYVHFGPNNMKQGSHIYNEWYWPQHILGTLLFALPTGLVVVSVWGLEHLITTTIGGVCCQVVLPYLDAPG